MTSVTGHQDDGSGRDDGATTVRSVADLNRLLAAQGLTRRGNGATPAAREVSLERATATALARAAEKQARIPVFVERMDQGPMALPELGEILPERAILVVVEGPRETIGVVALCPNVLASLIEMQAIGRVTSRPVVPRRPTRTDAAISADFVNLLLSELAKETHGRFGQPDYGSFRYATYMDDPRALALMFEDDTYARLDLQFRMGAGGQRDGRVLIVLPDIDASTGRRPPDDKSSPAAPLAVGTAKPASQQQNTISLAEAVQDAPVQLVGILCRRMLSLQTLRSLGPGSLIPLPHNVLDEARVETRLGQLLARGRLGEAEGYHAIRLRECAQAISTSAGTAPPAPAPLTTEPPLDDLSQPDPFRATTTASIIDMARQGAAG